MILLATLFVIIGPITSVYGYVTNSGKIFVSGLVITLLCLVLGVFLSSVGKDKLVADCKAKGDNILIQSGRDGYLCIKRSTLG